MAQLSDSREIRGNVIIQCSPNDLYIDLPHVLPIVFPSGHRVQNFPVLHVIKV